MIKALALTESAHVTAVSARLKSMWREKKKEGKRGGFATDTVSGETGGQTAFDLVGNHLSGSGES